MKKLVISLLLACGLAALASAATPPTRVVLESSTNARTGNVTKLFVGPGSFRQLDDGSTLVTASPLVIVTDSEGVEIKRETTGADIVVRLSAEQSAGISQLFLAAYQAQKAEAARLVTEAAERAAADAKAKADAEAAALAAPKTTLKLYQNTPPSEKGLFLTTDALPTAITFGSPATLTITGTGKITYNGTPDEAAAAFIEAMRPQLLQLYASAK